MVPVKSVLSLNCKKNSCVNSLSSLGIVDPVVESPSLVSKKSVPRHSDNDVSERKFHAICSAVGAFVGAEVGVGSIDGS